MKLQPWMLVIPIALAVGFCRGLVNDEPAEPPVIVLPAASDIFENVPRLSDDEKQQIIEDVFGTPTPEGAQ